MDAANERRRSNRELQAHARHLHRQRHQCLRRQRAALQDSKTASRNRILSLRQGDLRRRLFRLERFTIVSDASRMSCHRLFRTNTVTFTNARRANIAFLGKALWLSVARGIDCRSAIWSSDLSSDFKLTSGRAFLLGFFHPHIERGQNSAHDFIDRRQTRLRQRILQRNFDIGTLVQFLPEQSHHRSPKLRSG